MLAHRHKPAVTATTAETRPDAPAGPEPGTITTSRTTTQGTSETMRRLRTAWSDRRIGVGLAVVVAALWGLVAGWSTPRGPITVGEGLSAMFVSLAVGGAAGLATRSRWAMLLAPAVFVAVFEFVRLGADGPTVDGIHVSTYGLLAFVVGRGVHGVLALMPMVLGAAVGAGLARHVLEGRLVRRGRARAGLVARRAVAALVAVGLVAVAVMVARPATTDPIVGADGEPIAGSIAELTDVEIGGHDLSLMIRGHSADNPVMLFLAGGPGGTEMGAMRRHLAALERDFVVVTFDQRGSGRSYGQLDPTTTLTFDRAVSDTIEVTSHLRERFGDDKVHVVGQSWGTILGVLAVQQGPDLYEAFVGTGQMVSPVETDRIIYEDTLRWARDTDNVDVVDTLTEIGPPPYASILDYEPALSYEHDVYAYDHSRNSEGEGGFSENLVVEEYTLLEQVHNLGGFLDTFSVLYPQIQHVDLRDDARRLDVPIYLVQGRHEARARAELADEWFDAVQAPRKQMIELDTSGHRPLFEQPERFHQVMTDIVLGQATADRP